jgi:hypothetical protein
MIKVKVKDYDIKGWTKHLVVIDEDHNEYPCRLDWSDGYGYELEWHEDIPEIYTKWDEEDPERIFFEAWLDEQSEGY